MDMECPRSKPIPPDDLRPPLETISAIYHRVAYGARADFLLPWGEGAPRGRMRVWSAHKVLANFPQPAVPATWALAGDQGEKV